MSTASQHPDLASLSLYYDGEGADEFLATIEEHLATCESCRAHLAKFAALSEAIQEPELKAPSSVLDGVRVGMKEPTPLSRPAPYSPPRWWSGAAAAIVLVGLVFVAYRLGDPPVEVALETEPPAKQSGDGRG